MIQRRKNVVLPAPRTTKAVSESQTACSIRFENCLDGLSPALVQGTFIAERYILLSEPGEVPAMSAVSKALSFVFGLALLVLTAGPAEATISKTEQTACDVLNEGCEDNCFDKARECGRTDSDDYDRCRKDCSTICDYKRSDCLRDADKDAPKPIRPLPKKDLPELQPVEPKMQPKVQPEGGVQQ